MEYSRIFLSIESLKIFKINKLCGKIKMKKKKNKIYNKNQTSFILRLFRNKQENKYIKENNFS